MKSACVHRTGPFSCARSTAQLVDHRLRHLVRPDLDLLRPGRQQIRQSGARAPAHGPWPILPPPPPPPSPSEWRSISATEPNVASGLATPLAGDVGRRAVHGLVQARAACARGWPMRAARSSPRPSPPRRRGCRRTCSRSAARRSPRAARSAAWRRCRPACARARRRGSRPATRSTVSRHRRDVSRMFALSTEVTRPRRDGEAAISKASRAILSISSTE